jgi:hypothetical protein
MKKYLFAILILLSTNFYSQKKIKTQKNKLSKTEIAKPVAKPVETVIFNTVVNDAVKNTEVAKKTEIISDCVYFQNYKNEIENYKSTKISLVYLRTNSGNFERIYFSLAKKNEIPYLNIDLIYKGSNEEYGNNLCFGNKSKLIFNLKDGKKVTLLHIENEDCYKNVINGTRDVSRNLSGSFRFLQDDISALKNSIFETLQLVFENEKKDYEIQNKVFSELENITYEPQIYFQKNIQCIEN